MAGMILVQMKNRVVLEPGTQLLIQHVADVKCDDQEMTNELLHLPLSCVSTPGIWRIPAIHVADTLRGFSSDMLLLGPDECFVHLIPKNKQNRTHLLRTIFAFVLLMLGSMLAISWFHADVNMVDAQKNLFQIITGKEPENMQWITIAYAIGVFLGVFLFYAILGKKDSVSPLEIKLSEYHATSEKATGKVP